MEGLVTILKEMLESIKGIGRSLQFAHDRIERLERLAGINDKGSGAVGDEFLKSLTKELEKSLED